ncbi:5-formyltetrahydrofolate cyclo-ligase [Azomonas agilis]|uniref:5-formyltetrahydrofolate cyclo-ligase n=1 Tax=Azomonas agilis TaxID=116849 RepID=A0A562IL60_9GAMM|nr:5-formyltetrahydrofolate cyclo-ligase [Azomonas agilis]TWH71465.1 5-formyltetrahydrofolate cyclo-ligase [Azomonas agilis]
MIHTYEGSRSELRRLLRQRRRALSAQQQRQAAQKLYRQLVQHPIFRRARHIAFYLANDGEIDPHYLLKAAQRRNKAIYLPVLARWPRHKMHFQRLRPKESLSLNRFRIAEPRFQPTQQRAAWTLSLILMPLVGFDEQGGRLGMGGGFYDRCLAFHNQAPTHRPLLFGLAHECQKVDQLPIQTWDIRMQSIVTDGGFYSTR